MTGIDWGWVSFVPIWAAAGAVLAIVYLRLVRLSVDALLSGGVRFGAALALAARLGLAAGFLVLAARQGALPLLAGAGGFLAARAVVLDRLTREDG